MPVYNAPRTYLKSLPLISIQPRVTANVRRTKESVCTYALVPGGIISFNSQGGPVLRVHDWHSLALIGTRCQLLAKLNSDSKAGHVGSIPIARCHT